MWSRLPGDRVVRSAWPAWVPRRCREAFRAAGIDRPWSHQAQAADLAHAGQDVVLATGTASGKSLAYQLPALTALPADPRACVLYLAPTKALAADQLESLESLGLPGLRAGRLRRRHPDGRTGTGPGRTRTGC